MTNNSDIVKQAIQVGREVVEDIKARAVVAGLTQTEYTSMLGATIGMAAIELASEIIRHHRDIKSDMGMVAAKVQVGIIMDGVYRAVEAAERGGKDFGPSYPHGTVKVPGVK